MKLFTKTNKRVLLILFFFGSLAALAFAGAYLLANSGNFAVLNPKGTIAAHEKNLLVFATLLCLIVVVPVYALTFIIAREYRSGNKKARYRPDWDHSRRLESIWWGVPLLLILILSVVTWKSSHDLDPFKPLASAEDQIKIQVVAMNWKWLFIYPEEKIATVNYVQLPVGKPVEFQITGDSAMNSFWIPQLGGQIYAMNGMATELHLKADQAGTYRGSSANISGEGFAGMNFTVKAKPQAEFDKWVGRVKSSPNRLNSAEYAKLARPSQNNPPSFYVLAEDDLFNQVIRKYLLP